MKKLVLSTLVIGATLVANANSLESTLKNTNFSNDNKISQNSNKLNIGEIFNFIKKHRKYISEHNLLTVNFYAKTEQPSDNDYSTNRTTTSNSTTSNYNSSYSNDYSRRDSAYLELRYPLYDASREKSMKNEKLRNNKDILYSIRDYYNALDRLKSYKNTIDFYNKKLIIELSKNKKDRGFITTQLNSVSTIQSNEDYYEEKILNAKNNILSNVDFMIKKEYLLDLVEENYKSSLDRILSK